MENASVCVVGRWGKAAVEPNLEHSDAFVLCMHPQPYATYKTESRYYLCEKIRGVFSRKQRGTFTTYHLSFCTIPLYITHPPHITCMHP